MIEIPQNFPGKQDGDKIVMFVRKHWFKYVIVSLISVLLFSIPVIAIIFYLLSRSEFSPLSIEITTAGIGVCLLIVMALIIQAFVDFYLDLFVITEEKVVFVRQNGFFNQQIDEAHLSDISEVGVDVKGILNSMLGYGNLIIHMGNDEAILTIDDIPNPGRVGREIMRLHKEHFDRADSEKKDEDKSETEVTKE